MSGPIIHFLNVKDGDCSIIQHSSNRVTMIDICNGNEVEADIIKAMIEKGGTARPKGNFRMCKEPTNPIIYLKEKGIKNIFRFILTHPDMDHMDGIKELFTEKSVQNFWDSGVRKSKPDFKNQNRYKEHDWDFYEGIINNQYEITVVSPITDSKGKYYNSDDGNGEGDSLYIIAPNKKLIDVANTSGNTNDASYVIVFKCSAGKIIFCGDSDNKTWEYILENHEELVKDAAVLFAPHHGRKSGRSYDFLDIVEPRISFFGCASSNDLAYSAWNSKELEFFTNNQCGNVIIYPSGKKVKIYIENESFAEKYTEKNTFYSDGFWYLGEF